jgi:uncharacterized protein YkwD
MKKLLLILITSFALLSFINSKQFKIVSVKEEFCITKEDLKLYKLINSYRKTLGLDSIPLSKSLSKVAITHNIDLSINHPDKPPCNLHSWSKGDKWEGCCFKGGNEGPCMWSKPKEIAGYKADGFEIATYYSDKMTAEMALDLWKKSKGHNAVICNKDIWKSMKWKAMGISVYGNYAVVWFGAEIDLEGMPKICK